MVDPKDYTLEEWVKLWQAAHKNDSEETYTYPEYLKKFAPKLPVSIPTPIPFDPYNPYDEWWRKTITSPAPTITTDHT